MSNTKNEKKSIYVVCAASSFTSGKKLTINDLTILQRSSVQLTYRGTIPRNQKPKPFESNLTTNHDKKEQSAFGDELFIQYTVREVVAGPVINSLKRFYEFVLNYLGDVSNLESADKVINEMPENLKKTFYAYSTKDEAEKERTKLEQRQQDSYNGVNEILKPYMPKQRIVVVDLIVALADYGMDVMKDILNDPKAKEQFMKNLQNSNAMNEALKNPLINKSTTESSD